MSSQLSAFELTFQLLAKIWWYSFKKRKCCLDQYFETFFTQFILNQEFHLDLFHLLKDFKTILNFSRPFSIFLGT